MFPRIVILDQSASAPGPVQSWSTHLFNLLDHFIHCKYLKTNYLYYLIFIIQLLLCLYVMIEMTEISLGLLLCSLLRFCLFVCFCKDLIQFSTRQRFVRPCSHGERRCVCVQGHRGGRVAPPRPDTGLGSGCSFSRNGPCYGALERPLVFHILNY